MNLTKIAFASVGIVAFTEGLDLAVNMYNGPHPAVPESTIYSWIKETASISSATLLITEFTKHVFSETKSSYDDAYFAIVKAPFYEEIVFRTLLQGGIKLAQYYTFRVIRWRDATDAELASQKTFRVWATAIAFGLVHATNDHEFMISKITQIYITTFCGITTGYIKEDTGTTGLTILCHAAHNFICQSVVVGFISPLTSIISVIAFDIILYGTVTDASKANMLCHSIIHITLIVASCTTVSPVIAVAALIGVNTFVYATTG